MLLHRDRAKLGVFAGRESRFTATSEFSNAAVIHKQQKRLLQL
jgi:hypothetical protein